MYGTVGSRAFRGPDCLCKQQLQLISSLVDLDVFRGRNFNVRGWCCMLLYQAPVLEACGYAASCLYLNFDLNSVHSIPSHPGHILSEYVQSMQPARFSPATLSSPALCLIHTHYLLPLFLKSSRSLFVSRSFFCPSLSLFTRKSLTMHQRVSHHISCRMANADNPSRHLPECQNPQQRSIPRREQ